jgi:hypothetical protein
MGTKRIELPKEEIISRYQSGESGAEIAEDFDCHHITICRRIDEWGVEKHPKGYHRRKHRAKFRTHASGHEKWEVRIGEGGTSFPVHRLQAVAEWGIDAVKEKVVHHKNEIPWDNRVENLEIMTKEDHVSHHMTGHDFNDHWVDRERADTGEFL